MLIDVCILNVYVYVRYCMLNVYVYVRLMSVC